MISTWHVSFAMDVEKAVSIAVHVSTSQKPSLGIKLLAHIAFLPHSLIIVSELSMEPTVILVDLHIITQAKFGLVDLN